MFCPILVSPAQKGAVTKPGSINKRSGEMALICTLPIGVYFAISNMVISSCRGLDMWLPDRAGGDSRVPMPC